MWCHWECFTGEGTWQEPGTSCLWGALQLRTADGASYGATAPFTPELQLFSVESINKCLSWEWNLMLFSICPRYMENCFAPCDETLLTGQWLSPDPLQRELISLIQPDQQIICQICGSLLLNRPHFKQLCGRSCSTRTSPNSRQMNPAASCWTAQYTDISCSQKEREYQPCAIRNTTRR